MAEIQKHAKTLGTWYREAEKKVNVEDVKEEDIRNESTEYSEMLYSQEYGQELVQLSVVLEAYNKAEKQWQKDKQKITQATYGISKELEQCQKHEVENKQKLQQIIEEIEGMPSPIVSYGTYQEGWLDGTALVLKKFERKVQCLAQINILAELLFSLEDEGKLKELLRKTQ